MTSKFVLHSRLYGVGRIWLKELARALGRFGSIGRLGAKQFHRGYSISRNMAID